MAVFKLLEPKLLNLALKLNYTGVSQHNDDRWQYIKSDYSLIAYSTVTPNLP
ncbi:hypothetical protein SAMN04488511_101129 [Pedobacter suwonensis]|uniref:Uncharacterized protein n=1 Tax=Pedobacter suwonensis TaxID=332999 RepID=A0A1I0SF81_9SPHI|nr:hypothetical protein SAMN04488511_101129 [Pedobacter suwonensis]